MVLLFLIMGVAPCCGVCLHGGHGYHRYDSVSVAVCMHREGVATDQHIVFFLLHRTTIVKNMLSLLLSCFYSRWGAFSGDSRGSVKHPKPVASYVLRRASVPGGALWHAQTPSFDVPQ